MCAAASCTQQADTQDDSVAADGSSAACNLQSKSHSTGPSSIGQRVYENRRLTGVEQLPAAVNKLDEYFMADGVTVVLIYLIADALVLLYPHLQAAIQAHTSRQHQRTRANPTDMETSPTVRVVTQVYHYDFGGVASFFATDATHVIGSMPGHGDGTEHTEQDDAKAPAAKDVAWKLLMYTDVAFRSYPAASNRANVQKLSEHQVLITQDSTRQQF